MTPRTLIFIVVITGSLITLTLFGPWNADPTPLPKPTSPPEQAAEATPSEFPPLAGSELIANLPDPSTKEWSPELEELRLQLLEIMHQSLEGTTPNERIRLLAARKAALQELLDSLGPESVELLIALLWVETDFMLRRQLILALGRIGTDEAVDALVALYEFDRELGKETELNYVIKSIGMAKTGHSFNVLADLITDEQAEIHRFRFVEQLGYHPDNLRAVPIFLEAADPEQQPYFKTRSRAALALKWAGDPRAAPQIEALLDREQNEYARQALVGTLGDLGATGSIPSLETVARTDTNHQTRMSAVRALAKIESTAIRAILEEILETDGNQYVRREARQALDRIPR